MGNGLTLATHSSVYWKIHHLQESPVFASISPENLQDIANCFTSVVFSRGPITTKLDPGVLYYIAEGQIEVFVSPPTQTEDGPVGKEKSSDVYLGKKKRGDFLHPFKKSTSNPKSPRKDECDDKPSLVEEAENQRIRLQCVESTTCLKLNKKKLQSLSNLIAKQDSDKALVATISFLYNDIYHVMQQLHFLSEATQLEAKVLADMCKPQFVKKGEQLFKKNDISDCFYLILRGSCSVRSADQYEIVTPLRRSLVNKFTRQVASDTDSVTTTEDGDGSAAGEDSGAAAADNLVADLRRRARTRVREAADEHVMTLLNAGAAAGFADAVFGVPRVCSVVAESDAVALRVAAGDLAAWGAAMGPGAGAALRRNAYEKLLFRLKRLGVPIMSGFPEAYFRGIAEHCELVRCAPGESIFKDAEGAGAGEKVDLSASVYVVLTGEVEVSTPLASKGVGGGGSIRAPAQGGGGGGNDDEDSTGEGGQGERVGGLSLGTGRGGAGPLGSSRLPQRKRTRARLRRGSSLGQDVLYTPRAQRRVAVVARTAAVLLKVRKEGEQVFRHDREAYAQYEICVRKARCKLESVLGCEKGLYYFKVYLAGFGLEHLVHFIEDVQSLDKLVREGALPGGARGEAARVMMGSVIATYVDAAAAEGSGRRVPLREETRRGLEGALEACDGFATPRWANEGGVAGGGDGGGGGTPPAKGGAVPASARRRGKGGAAPLSPGRGGGGGDGDGLSPGGGGGGTALDLRRRSTRVGAGGPELFLRAMEEVKAVLRAEHFDDFKGSVLFEELLNSFTSEKWQNVSFEKG